MFLTDTPATSSPSYSSCTWIHLFAFEFYLEPDAPNDKIDRAFGCPIRQIEQSSSDEDLIAQTQH